MGDGKLNIRVGGKYRTRDGGVVKITGRQGGLLFPFVGCVLGWGETVSWGASGNFDIEGIPDSLDLVSEITEPTPSELVRSGSPNVVGDDFFAMSTKAHQLMGKPYRIEHDGFEGDVIGSYVTREGKRGVVLQQHGTRVVHVYGEKWLKNADAMIAEGSKGDA